MAQKLLQQASARKIPATVAELDSYAQALPKQTPVFVFCSTYNGQPPDNASKFAAWLSQDLPHDTLAGVEFAVLGCGNKQWRATFQKVPQLLFDRMQAVGAKALLPFAGCDADGDFDASAESFFGSVWSLLSARSPAGKRGAAAAATEDTQNAYSVEVVNYAGSESGALPPSRAPPFGRSTLHAGRWCVASFKQKLWKINPASGDRLPDGVSSAGDHLGVFPENPRGDRGLCSTLRSPFQ